MVNTIFVVVKTTPEFEQTLNLRTFSFGGDLIKMISNGTIKIDIVKYGETSECFHFLKSRMTHRCANSGIKPANQG